MYLEKITQTEMESGVLPFVNLSQKPHIIYAAIIYARGLCSRIQGVKPNAKLYTMQYSTFYQTLQFPFPPRTWSG